MRTEKTIDACYCYVRANFLLNQLENAGVIGPYASNESWNPRDILLPNPEERAGGD